MMRLNGKLLAGIAVSAAVIGGGVAIATTGAVADDPPSVRVAQAPSATLPDAVKSALDREESAVGEFLLNQGGARSITTPSGETVWYTPGERGACLWPEEGAGSCTNAKGVTSGKLALVALPPIVGEIVPGKPIKYGAGPTTVIGRAPAGTTTVNATDANGRVVASADTVEGFYEIVVDDDDVASLSFEGNDATAAKLPL